MGLLWNILRIVSASTALGWEWSSSIISDVEPRHLRGLSADTVGGVNLVDVSFVVICVVMAGFASGLTQGLLSLDPMEMEIKARSGTAEEKIYAAKLAPIIERHHLLLVTLMLWNASSMEALPIFLAVLVPEYLAIIISVTLVLFVGEIIPASIMTGPRQLQITASLTPLVYLVLVLFFPIAYPISLGLDFVIGHSDMTIYSRTEISTMMRLQREEGVKRQTSRINDRKSNTEVRDTLYEEDEVVIIDGALKYREMAVSEVMTIAENVFMISVTDTLNYKLIYEIFKAGYSRIPVYDRDFHDIVGLILAKDLIFIDPEDETPVSNFMDLFGRKPAVVWHDSKLGETLSMFKAEKSHMAIVRDVVSEGQDDPYYTVVGIITLEDIVEEILGTEIEDETDVIKGADGRTNHPMRDSIMMQPIAVRDPELARLQTLSNAKVTTDSLSEEEVHSIGIYLFTNVPQIQRMFRNNMKDLQRLVRTSAVITLTRRAPVGEEAHTDDYLYRKGRLTNTCMLILSGSVQVVNESTDAEAAASRPSLTTTDPNATTTTSLGVKMKGPWSTIAPEALEAAEGTFTTDFTVTIASQSLRYLRLSNFTPTPAQEEKQWAIGNHSGEHQALRKMRSFGTGFLRTNSGRHRSEERKSTENRSFSIGGETGVRLRRDKSIEYTREVDFNVTELYGSKLRDSNAILGARESLDRSSTTTANGGTTGGNGGEVTSRAGSLTAPFSFIRNAYSTTTTETTTATAGPSAQYHVGFVNGEHSTSSSALRSTTAAKTRTVPGIVARETSEGGSTRNPLQHSDELAHPSSPTLLMAPVTSSRTTAATSSRSNNSSSNSPNPASSNNQL